MAPLYFSDQDGRSEVLHDLFFHMMPLALASASCGANNIVNSTIALLSLRESKWCATWLFWSCGIIGTCITWCWWHCQQHLYIPCVEDDQSEVQLNIFGHVIPLVPVSVSLDTNGIIIFFRSRWQKWYTTWLFLQCHATETGVGTTWCYQHAQCHHCIL